MANNMQQAIQRRMALLSGTGGMNDSRSSKGIMSRGANVYKSGTAQANRGLGSLGGKVQPNKLAITRRLGR